MVLLTDNKLWIMFEILSTLIQLILLMALTGAVIYTIIRVLSPLAFLINDETVIYIGILVFIIWLISVIKACIKYN